MTDETTPDAVEMLRSLIGTCCSLGSWMTVERLRGIRSAILAERARHAEEVAELHGLIQKRNHQRESLRDQLRKVEGERAMWEKTASVLSGKLDSLRSLLPDVRACATYLVTDPQRRSIGAAIACLDAARRILTALDSPECPECHRNSDHKMSCGRGGSKGGRFNVSLDSRKDGSQ